MVTLERARVIVGLSPEDADDLIESGMLHGHRTPRGWLYEPHELANLAKRLGIGRFKAKSVPIA